MAIKSTRPCRLSVSQLIRTHLSTLNVSELRRTVVAVLVLLIALAPGSSRAQQVPEEFSIESVAGSLDRDVIGFTFLPDGRILLIQKESGTVKLIVGGVVGPEPALTVDRLVPSSERGLLGIAVDPDFPDSNYIYLFHSRNDSTNRVTRFAAHGDLQHGTSDSLVLDAESSRTLASFPDTTRFHNGGTLRFGRDKMLYISHGDDAYANRVQSLSTVNGKIFRITRDGDTPADNPVFPDAPPDALPETYAFGLRNPFRFSIDPETGALFIGDVGTNLFEEINVSNGGENFGYPHYEGHDFFRPWEPLIPPDPTFPVFDYPHNRSAGAGSVIALSAYRPVSYPDDKSFPPLYQGAYFYSDFFDDELRFVKPDESGTWVSASFASGFNALVDGSIGPDGSLYVLEFGGELFRISYEGGSEVAIEDGDLPAAFALGQSYPNPFARTTTIPFTTGSAANVRLIVVDILGRRIRDLASGIRPPGQYEIAFDAAGLPSGVYLYRLEAGDFVEMKRMVVVR